jgi:hypothetical protein
MRETIAGRGFVHRLVVSPLHLAVVAGPVGCIRGDRPVAFHDNPERKEI